MAKSADSVPWSYTGQLDYTCLDQSPRTKDHPDQWLLLAIRPLPCHRHKLSQVDGHTKILGACSAVHTNTNLFQLW